MARQLYRTTVIGVFVFAACLFVRSLADEPKETIPSVFEMPRIQIQFARLQSTVLALFKEGKYAEAEQRCGAIIKLVPHEPSGHYNLACAQARHGKSKEALASLTKAVELGFKDAKLMREDADFESLRDEKAFSDLIEAAKNAKPKPSPWQRKIEPGLVKDGVALVAESNTAWDAKNGVFRVFFKWNEAEPRKDEKPAIIKGHGKLGERLLKWSAEGTAAGNHGDLYDNQDGDHSNMAFAQFPQLTRIEFDEVAKRFKIHMGLQNRFFYNAITLGNSSTALTSGPYWRSQPRLAYGDPRTVGLLYAQYVGNHLYVYPEHRDHDPGHNGDGGYGDMYPANTPFVIISQGSSGSDRVFLDAVACTLAAFRPDVKAALAKRGALMPMVQMIFRMSNKQVESDDDYLSGKAHPTVFDGKQINASKMVDLANEMTLDNLPPVVQLKVIEEDEAVVGRDYFEFAPRECFFDTPSAIARIMRSTKYERRVVVSAEASRDLNKRDLKWHWVVLRGDAERIKIKPLNENSSRVELRVPYHERQTIQEGSKMESNRVDIGVFVHNGKYFSAPGFVTFFSLDNEQRVYNDKKLIQSVEYKTRADGGNYADPVVATSKSWRDEYRYDDKDRLIGWTRIRGEQSERFTADGALITKTDDRDRPIEARTVKYIAKPRDRKAPILVQQPGDELLYYEYSSPEDHVGRIRKREIIKTSNSVPAKE